MEGVPVLVNQGISKSGFFSQVQIRSRESEKRLFPNTNGAGGLFYKTAQGKGV